jgi:hypothetical protein
VDFIPKGTSMRDQGSPMVRVVKGSIPNEPWSCFEVSFGMAFESSKAVGRQPQVTQRYPPYSRLALERVLTAKGGGWGSGRRTILK